MKKFLFNSNLPQNNVSEVIAGIDDLALKEELIRYGINTIETIQKPLLEPYVSNHADVLVHYLGNGKIMVDSSQKKIISSLKKIHFQIQEIDNVSSPYPNDCILNCCDIGDYIICNKDITHSAILDNAIKNHKQIINVKQGYAKCSICILKKNVIITDDDSIYKAVLKYKNISVLRINKGSIRLKNCDYGFIGGCGGLIGKDKIFFNGDITKHSDYNEINKFLEHNNIQCYSIQNKPLTDIGSIIPILEGE